MGSLKIKSVSRLLRSAMFAGFVLVAVAGQAMAEAPIEGVPEIDPSSMGTALALVAGGISLLMARRSQ